MMRRKDRAVTDHQAIVDLVHSCKVCRLAMQDEDGLYIVPLSFGARWAGERLTLYFHGAAEGRKIRAMRQNPRVAFEMDCDWRLTGEGGNACVYSCDFRSLIGTGTVRFLTDPQERLTALSAIMAQQTGKEFSFTEKEIASVTLFALEADAYSAKAKQTREG